MEELGGGLVMFKVLVEEGGEFRGLEYGLVMVDVDGGDGRF